MFIPPSPSLTGRLGMCAACSRVTAAVTPSLGDACRPAHMELLSPFVDNPFVLCLAARLDELERGSGDRRSATDSSLAELSPFSTKSVGSEPTLQRTPGKKLILPQEIPCLDAPSQLTQLVCTTANAVGAKCVKATKRLKLGGSVQDSSAHKGSERRSGEAEECVEEKNVGQNLALGELLESLNRLKGAAEEEACRLGRVECEMHQQVLDNRHRLDNLSAEFGSLQQIIPGLHAWKQGLEDELNSLRKEVEGELLAAKQGLDDELERSTAQLQSELQSLAQDLGQEVRASTHELDVKLERLTVVVGTAAFFQRGSQGDTLSHSVSSVVNGHSLQLSQTKALAHESVHAGTSHNEDAALGDTDLHFTLKRLGLAVKVLQRNLDKTNKGVVQVKEECSSECKALRSDLRRQEVTPARACTLACAVTRPLPTCLRVCCMRRRHCLLVLASQIHHRQKNG